MHQGMVQMEGAALEGFQPYALTSAIVGAQLILLAFWTGTVRAMKKQYVIPEDAVLNKSTRADGEHPDTLRAGRAHMNALENAVPFFIIGGLYVVTGASKSSAQIYCYTFLAMRLLHSVFYLAGKQPFRSITFGVGALAVLGMAYHVIRALV
jgi:uncharacterized MAPEG superfamily protein